MIYKALHRHADTTPRKIRPFANMIRGRVAEEALELLRFCPNRGARLLEAVLKSALGNAQDRGATNIEELVVEEACVDGGPILKRMMPRARGSWYPIKKRYSHIRVTLVDEEALAQAALQAQAAQQQAAAPAAGGTPGTTGS